MEGHLLYERLEKIAKRNPVSFHVPGHKNGRAFEKLPLFEAMGRLDLTELPETDNLHEPTGLLKEAQERAASVYGSRKSFFLVNGTTGGIHAMLSAVCRPGDGLLMQRDCHRSVYHAVALNRLVPRYLRPAFHGPTGRKLSVTPQQVASALKRHPDIKAVLVTAPAYDGVCPDIRAMAEAAHGAGALLLVDGAHGAHLGFTDRLPPNPLAEGADIVVQSAHKTLPAFTQGSLLHVGSDRIDVDRLGRMLTVYQSASPSYLLMAGIDAAVAFMEREGAHHLERLLEETGRFAERLEREAGLFLWDRTAFFETTGFDLDPTKMLIDCAPAGLTGFQTGTVLRNRFDIQIEMAGLGDVLLVASVANNGRDFERAASALSKIVRDKSLPRRRIREPEYSYGIPERALLPGEAFYKPVVRMPLEAAVGRLAGEHLAPHPPGIPLVCPGERIPLEAVLHLKALREETRRALGLGEMEEMTVLVIEEEER